MFTGFGAVVTAMVTPFDSRGEVNYGAAAEMARFLVRHGSSGIVVAGTTGESPVLSTAEKLELFRVVADAVGKDAAVIGGAGDNATAASAALTGQASQTGIDGVMLVTPYYNKPSQEGLYEHFKVVAAATELPVMLYNVPGRTAVNMTAETTLRLAEIENIAAIKEASGNLEQAAAICDHAPPGFVLYAGDDSLTLPLLSVGAAGVVSVASNVIGPRIAEMIEHFKQGRVSEAARIHRELLPLFRGLFITTNPVPVKAAMNMLGFSAGNPRLPLLPLDGEMLPELQSLLRRYGIIK